MKQIPFAGLWHRLIASPKNRSNLWLERSRFWNRQNLVYAQLESQRQRIEELKLARPRLQEELDRLRQSGPSEPERDTFSFLESVRIDLLRERARAAKAAAAQSVSESTLENARDVLEARQRERRRIKELVETTPSDGNRLDLHFAERRSNLAAELVSLRLAEGETQSL